MKYEHRPAWIELALFGAAVLGLVLALVFRVWLGAFGSGVLLISLLPRITDGLRALREGRTWDSEEFNFTLPLSRAQQIALGLLVVTPVLIWRVVAGGWVAVAIGGPLFVLYVVWLARVLWREGWSDTPSNDE